MKKNKIKGLRHVLSILLITFAGVFSCQNAFSQENDSILLIRPQLGGFGTVDSIQSTSKEKQKTLKTKSDTTKSGFGKGEISPKKAAIYAAICPGLGQMYNHKYWKLPIVYGGIGAGLFLLGRNAHLLKTYNHALDFRLDTLEETLDPFVGLLTDDQLFASRDYYRRNVQLSAFGTVAFWGLSIIDAVVDAHIRPFDISDDLSMQVKPKLLTVNNNFVPSLNVTLRFNQKQAFRAPTVYR